MERREPLIPHSCVQCKMVIYGIFPLCVMCGLRWLQLNPQYMDKDDPLDREVMDWMRLTRKWASKHMERP